MAVDYPEGHHDRFDPTKHYDKHLFRAGKVLQAAELNEIQSEQHHRLKQIADSVFTDGDIVRDCDIVIDKDAGTILCRSGAVYAHGAVRGVAEATLTAPMTGAIQVGVIMVETVVTDEDDPDLRDPASATRNYREPGAFRLKRELVWSLGGDGFLPLWDVLDGELQPHPSTSGSNAIELALEKYDRDSVGGHYVVRGLRTRQEDDLPSGEQSYTVTEGEARVSGRAIAFPASRRIIYDAEPDLKRVDSEPHLSDSEASQEIQFSRWPIAGTPEIRITARKTVTITHGAFTGVADPLPDESVIAIDQVKQGSTVYQSGTSWLLVDAQIDWSPSGPEPAPGTVYQVTYQYIKNATPLDLTDRGCRVEGALVGTLTLVSYDHALRRIDRLCIDRDGEFLWVRGTPSQWTPMPPRIPPGKLALASVHQFWDDRRKVVLDGVRAVPMSDLAHYRSEIDFLREDQAEIRLAVDVAGRYSGIKKGLFADPLLSDDHRDAGLPQTAAVGGGVMELPMHVSVYQLGDSEFVSPPHARRAILCQNSRTGDMQVNPYMAFEPPLAEMQLNPAADRWVEVQETRLPDVFRTRTASSGRTPGSVESVTDVISESRRAGQQMRQIPVEFTIRKFGAGEILSGLFFDGLDVLPPAPVVAGPDGIATGTFTIPPNISTGTKSVVATGAGGGRAEAFFTGEHTILERVLRTTTTRFVRPVDPVAQTFTLDRVTQLSGVDLWFTEVGSTDLIVDIRHVENGTPTLATLARARKSASEVSTSDSTRFTFAPILLQPDTEYAIVVMCNDPVARVSVATLGDFDAVRQKWVTSQPYAVGVLLSSSNATTWTAHQDKDLQFCLLEPEYTSTEYVHELGTASVSDATDLVVMGAASLPSHQTSLVFRVGVGSNPPVELAPGEAMRLAERFTGSVSVAAVMRGTSRLAPVLDPGVQLIAGDLQTEGTYISPMITADPANPSSLRVIFEAALPSGATVEVHASTQEVPTTWTPVPVASTSPFTAGVIEFTHQLNNITAERVRFRIKISGSHTARPALMNIRAVVL